jgi:hypothetical protein
MLKLIVFALFDGMGVAFMLYVLVNFHHELKRSRNESTHCHCARVSNNTKACGSISNGDYAPAQEGQTFKRVSASPPNGSSQPSRGPVLRRTS